MYNKFIKRCFDILLSFSALILLSPLFLILCCLVKISSTGPVIFKQIRMGKNEKQFQLYKFRTMKMNTPTSCPTHLLENPDQWLTGIGEFLRKTSLDELPQLYNILKGDMSIVGPRPSLLNQYDLNSLRNRNGSSSVRPGLTGLAQINGRDELSIEKKAEYDGIYAENITFLNDIKIIIRTFYAIFTHEGIQEGKQ